MPGPWTDETVKTVSTLVGLRQLDAPVNDRTGLSAEQITTLRGDLPVTVINGNWSALG